MFKMSGHIIGSPIRSGVSQSPLAILLSGGGIHPSNPTCLLSVSTAQLLSKGNGSVRSGGEAPAWLPVHGSRASMSRCHLRIPGAGGLATAEAALLLCPPGSICLGDCETGWGIVQTFLGWIQQDAAAELECSYHKASRFLPTCRVSKYSSIHNNSVTCDVTSGA